MTFLDSNDPENFDNRSCLDKSHKSFQSPPKILPLRSNPNSTGSSFIKEEKSFLDLQISEKDNSSIRYFSSPNKISLPISSNKLVVISPSKKISTSNYQKDDFGSNNLKSNPLLKLRKYKLPLILEDNKSTPLNFGLSEKQSNGIK